jgi:hypothetical protein
MTLFNLKDKAEVEAALAERRASAPEKIRNEDLPAGSPIYYYCKSCGHQTAILAEGWIYNPPPKYCDFCTLIREAGWVEL